MHTDEQSPDPSLPVVISPQEPEVDVVGGEAEPTPAPEPPAEPVYCRHCGEQAPEGTDADTNWLCKECERYQDSQVCPTCQSVVSASQLPEDMIPEAHAPKKHKKAKE